MGYETDFLEVGDGERSGDAIALRFGNLFGRRNEQIVIVVDGGFTDSGEKLVDHIGRYYDTDRADVVVSTHPDADHAAGLHVVLENMQVGCLLMHQPWNHTDQIARMFRDGRVTDTSVSAALRRSLETVRSLETLAKRKRIEIVEPFEGVHGWDGSFLVLGPSIEYYESLLPTFRGTPEPRFGTLGPGLLGRAVESAKRVAENWGFETLDDRGETSAENNSGTVILLTPEPGKRLLLTADTGIPALSNAIKALDRMGFDYSELRLVQVPHHGSRRNVGPTILDRLLGPKQLTDEQRRSAYVSASKDAPKHPSRKVTNAFRRRGAWVYSSEGQTIRYHHDAPDRGWTALSPVQFYTDVED